MLRYNEARIPDTRQQSVTTWRNQYQIMSSIVVSLCQVPALWRRVSCRDVPGGGAVSGPLGPTVPASKVLLMLIIQECKTIFVSGMTVVEGVRHWTRCVNKKKLLTKSKNGIFGLTRPDPMLTDLGIQVVWSVGLKIYKTWAFIMRFFSIEIY